MTLEYCMARGFESKDVEYQQAERERTRSAQQAPPPEGTAASRRQSLMLSLTRLRHDREAAHAPAHRTMLDGAIAAIEAELASLA
ncbi:MAG: hypothetical protein U0Q11_10380 [Vicinamibacterales bacterium]